MIYNINYIYLIFMILKFLCYDNYLLFQERKIFDITKEYIIIIEVRNYVYFPRILKYIKY